MPNKDGKLTELLSQYAAARINEANADAEFKIGMQSLTNRLLHREELIGLTEMRDQYNVQAREISHQIREHTGGMDALDYTDPIDKTVDKYAENRMAQQKK